MQTSFLKEFFSYFFGNMTPAYLLASMIFLLIGAVLSIGINVLGRGEHSPNTPAAFSWGFFLRDNWLRFLFNIIAAYSIVRFFSDIFPGLNFSMAWAWILGLIFDWVWVALRELKHVAVGKLERAMSQWNNDDNQKSN
jgi:hypothetical protein